MLDRLLDLFRVEPPFPELAPALRALGVTYAVDLAVAEHFVFHPGTDARRLTDWLDAYPWIPGLGKPQPPKTTADRDATLQKLVEGGALSSTGGQRYAPTDTLLAVLPGYARARVALPDEGPRGALDLDRAMRELQLARVEDGEHAPHLLRALGVIASSIAPPSTDDLRALEADLVVMSDTARRLALAIAGPASTPGTSLSSALHAAARATLAALAPLADDAAGARPLDALRLLVLRFADAAVLDFQAGWLARKGAVVNLPRREELCRRFARFASLDVVSAGAREAPLSALAGLLRCDHRREALFDQELEHRAQVEALAQQKIAAEKQRRDAAAESYSSGRRE